MKATANLTEPIAKKRARLNEIASKTGCVKVVAILESGWFKKQRGSKVI